MNAPHPPLVSIHDLGVEFRRDGRRLAALADVSLELKPGERLAVIGESGSGKSTFALALAGLLPPETRVAGRIDWGGTRPVPGRDIGMVFQDPSGSFDPVMSIGDHIVEVIRTHGRVPVSRARERAVDLLDRVRLPEPARIARAYPHQLSGGQRQRAALAIALSTGPKLLIADEATSALDTVVQAEIVDLIDDLVRESRMALVFVTHDIALAARLADRIAVFYAGRLVELSPARDLVTAPRHPYAQALLDSHIGLDAEPGRAMVVIPGSPPDMMQPPAGCRFAPRCGWADGDCDVEPERLGTIRAVACHHPIETGGAG